MYIYEKKIDSLYLNSFGEFDFYQKEDELFKVQNGVEKWRKNTINCWGFNAINDFFCAENRQKLVCHSIENGELLKEIEGYSLSYHSFSEGGVYLTFYSESEQGFAYFSFDSLNIVWRSKLDFSPGGPFLVGEDSIFTYNLIRKSMLYEVSKRDGSILHEWDLSTVFGQEKVKVDRLIACDEGFLSLAVTSKAFSGLIQIGLDDKRVYEKVLRDKNNSEYVIFSRGIYEDNEKNIVGLHGEIFFEVNLLSGEVVRHNCKQELMAQGLVAFKSTNSDFFVRDNIVFSLAVSFDEEKEIDAIALFDIKEKKIVYSYIFNGNPIACNTPIVYGNKIYVTGMNKNTHIFKRVNS